MLGNKVALESRTKAEHPGEMQKAKLFLSPEGMTSSFLLASVGWDRACLLQAGV